MVQDLLCQGEGQEQKWNLGQPNKDVPLQALLKDPLGGGGVGGQAGFRVPSVDTQGCSIAEGVFFCLVFSDFYFICSPD